MGNGRRSVRLACIVSRKRASDCMRQCPSLYMRFGPLNQSGARAKFRFWATKSKASACQTRRSRVHDLSSRAAEARSQSLRALSRGTIPVPLSARRPAVVTRRRALELRGEFVKLRTRLVRTGKLQKGAGRRFSFVPPNVILHHIG